MKKIILWLAGLGALALSAWYFITRKPATAARTAQTTGTQAAQAPWFPGWSGFNTAQLQSTTSSVNSAFSGLKSLANNFGLNDGGTNPGVSVGGSKAGGTASSGSGAAPPVQGSPSDLGNQVAVSDQTSDAPLNGYNDTDYQSFGDDGQDDSDDA